MRKYYYYVVRTYEYMIPVTCVSYTGGFPLTDNMKFVKGRIHKDAIITFWAEISETEYNSLVAYNMEESR